MSPVGKLPGKVAVVTGAGRGIGRAIASAYAGEGAAVVCAARSAPQLAETVADIARADVTQLAEVEGLFKSAAEVFGGVDIVVINAGAHYDRSHVETGRPIG